MSRAGLSVFGRMRRDSATGPPGAGPGGRDEFVLAKLQLLITNKLDGLLHGDYLGLLPGAVEPLRAPGLKLPHIGWAHLHLESDSPLTDGIEEGEPFYFVHSLAARPRPEELIASATYGGRFAAIAGRGNVLGTQFHPEKSSAAGLRMLRNFAAVASGAPA